MNKFLCGCPKDKCTGGNSIVSSGLGKSMKVHITREDAFACYAKFLNSSGYTQIGAREFAAPNDGPVMLLRKKGKFGGKLRMGKNEKGSGKRVMSAAHTSGMVV